MGEAKTMLRLWERKMKMTTNEWMKAWRPREQGTATWEKVL